MTKPKPPRQPFDGWNAPTHTRHGKLIPENQRYLIHEKRFFEGLRGTIGDPKEFTVTCGFNKATYYRAMESLREAQE